MIAIGLGDEDHEGLLRVHSTTHHEFSHVVQVGTVALRNVTEGQELSFPALPYRVLQRMLARGHPVQVSLQGVDLACTKRHRASMSRMMMKGLELPEVPSSLVLDDDAWRKAKKHIWQCSWLFSASALDFFHCP